MISDTEERLSPIVGGSNSILVSNTQEMLLHAALATEVSSWREEVGKAT